MAALCVFGSKRTGSWESLVNEADYTVGARGRGTIVQSLVKYFFAIIFRYASITWNTAYIYILFCDNSGVADSRHPGRNNTTPLAIIEFLI